MKAYNKLIIYYFSGTGNAKKAAEWIIDIAKSKGLETALFNIDKNPKVNPYDFVDNTLVGFCSPTHGFNLPPIMLKFIAKFPKKINADAFILNTRAGMKLYKLFLPGLSGSAQIFPAFMLRLKGIRTVGFQPMDLPSNWISLHPGIREKIVISIFKRCKRKTEKFANKILAGKRVYKGLISLPIDIAILPITVGYYFIGRFGLAKTFIATNECNSCKLCYKSCPVQAIKWINDRPFWTFNCESCMRCMNTCPKRAIETALTFTILVWWLLFSIIPMYIIILLINQNFTNSEWIDSELFFRLVQISIGFFSLFISYKVLHYLMRFRIINNLIAYTSLTKYKFWRRYKAPKNI
ncbi:MAG: EFR1 family ferrodoxin [Saprospiraceae bacterium]|nr:EFR1 family ferrodoxin [Saprospiraceae bacterium]